jgi:hypothetical protein
VQEFPLLSADERIILIRIKVERAKKHLRDLAADISTVERRTVVIRKGYDNKGNRPPDNFSITMGVPSSDRFLDTIVCSPNVAAGVGDIAHNLRTALDHLMCHMLVVAGSAITNRDAFPISESVTRYESRRDGLVNRVRPKAIEALDLLKPYKGGNLDLWRIHELDRIDKHRAIAPFARDFIFFADWFDGDFLFKQDSPALAGLYDSQVEQDMQFEIEKSLSNPETSGRDAILPSLHQMIDVTESLVLSFKPFLE